MKYILTIIIVLISFDIRTSSQFINKFGIKGGVNVSSVTSGENNPVFFLKEPESRYNLINLDIGVFTELMDSRFFCISTELHYVRKGEENDNDIEIIYLNKESNIASYRRITDRFHYLSFQILPRWKYAVTSEDKLYIFGGPKFDFRLSNNNSRGNEDLILKNSVFESGFTVGLGNEYYELFYLELRFDYSFTNVYKITLGEETVSRKNITFSLITGLSLKKLFKTNL